MAQLSQEVLNRLKASARLRFDFAEGMYRSLRTVERWLEADDKSLASQAAVLLLEKLTGLTEQQILQQETAAATV
jgi:hypothetical protein